MQCPLLYSRPVPFYQRGRAFLIVRRIGGRIQSSLLRCFHTEHLPHLAASTNCHINLIHGLLPAKIFGISLEIREIQTFHIRRSCNHQPPTRHLILFSLFAIFQAHPNSFAAHTALVIASSNRSRGDQHFILWSAQIVLTSSPKPLCCKCLKVNLNGVSFKLKYSYDFHIISSMACLVVYLFISFAYPSHMFILFTSMQDTQSRSVYLSNPNPRQCLRILFQDNYKCYYCIPIFY